MLPVTVTQCLNRMYPKHFALPRALEHSRALRPLSEKVQVPSLDRRQNQLKLKVLRKESCVVPPTRTGKEQSLSRIRDGLRILISDLSNSPSPPSTSSSTALGRLNSESHLRLPFPGSQSKHASTPRGSFYGSYLGRK